MRTVAVIALLALPLASSAADVVQPGTEGDWSRYDFVAGDDLLFFEDFAATGKGANPIKRLKDASARLDIQERDGTKWLRCRPPCSFDIVLPKKLPERFTVDFDLDGPGNSGLTFTTVNADGSLIDGGVVAQTSPSSLSYGDGGDDGAVNEIDRIAGLDTTKPMHISWSLDGGKVRAYAGHYPGLKVPKLAMPRTNRLRVEFLGVDDPTLWDENIPVYITNLRIAGGGNPVSFEELSKKGRLVLQGILFDTGSDRIRPESTPTLTAVAAMLAAHPELKLVVEGHTDNQGTAPKNLTLSEKRAAAVKAWLVTKHKVDAARLTPKGFGQTKPASTNDTAEGRQANRRVELSRM